MAEHPDILSTIVAACRRRPGQRLLRASAAGPARVCAIAEIWRTLHKWPSTAALSLDNYREFFLLRSKPPTQVKMGALGAYDDDAEDEHCADFKRVKTEGAALSASLAARRDAFAAPTTEIKEHGELRDPELEGLVLLVDVEKPGAGPT